MPDYPRCGTCRWWGDSAGRGLGDAEFDPEQRFCTRAFRWNKTWPYQPDDDVVGCPDVEEYPTVPPNFGCIHHSDLHPEDDDGD